MDKDPFWSSSDHPSLPAMTPSQAFWSQFYEYVTTYGLAFLLTTFTGGLTFGLALHFIQNVLPAKKAKKQADVRQRKEEELENEEANETAKIKIGDRMFTGRMNSKMISTLRKTAIYSEEPKRGLAGAMDDIRKEREALLAEEEDEFDEDIAEEEIDEEMIEREEEDLVMKKDEEMSLLEIQPQEADGKVSSSSNDEVLQEIDLLTKLGTLHGKLASAQLRAQARRMEKEMTQQERETEEEMRSRQLEGIMKLMEQNKEKFGMTEDDVKDQLGLYDFYH